MSQMTPELYDDLMLLRNVDPLGEIARLTEEIRQDGDCLYLKQLAVSGRDLMEAGIGPGKKVGETLNALLDPVSYTHLDVYKRQASGQMAPSG